MLFPKIKKIRNKKYQVFVCTLSCMLDIKGWLSCKSDAVPCGGYIQAHHLLKPWYGHKGTSLRASDNNCVPLCYKHHRQLHDCGNEDYFWTIYNLDEDYGRTKAKQLWDRYNEQRNS